MAPVDEGVYYLKGILRGELLEAVTVSSPHT